MSTSRAIAKKSRGDFAKRSIEKYYLCGALSRSYARASRRLFFSFLANVHRKCGEWKRLRVSASACTQMYHVSWWKSKVASVLPEISQYFVAAFRFSVRYSHSTITFFFRPHTHRNRFPVCFHLPSPVTKGSGAGHNLIRHADISVFFFFSVSVNSRSLRSFRRAVSK